MWATEQLRSHSKNMDLLQLQPDIIYGPVRSRRLGLSLGLNLLPLSYKLCSMNCHYCQYGWTARLTNEATDCRDLPSPAAVTHAVEEVLQAGQAFDYLTFSGNGEPTLHPDFPRIVDAIVKLRTAHQAKFKLALLSNGTTAGKQELQETLGKIDLPIMKLDAGNARMFKKINHPARLVRYEDVIRGLRSLQGIVIQTMFVRGSVDNSTDDEVAAWIDRLREIEPLWVQMYSLDRGTADHRLKQVPRARLEQIAARASLATGLKIDVF